MNMYEHILAAANLEREKRERERERIRQGRQQERRALSDEARQELYHNMLLDISTYQPRRKTND